MRPESSTEMSIEDMATTHAMNGGAHAPVNGYIPAVPAPPLAQAVAFAAATNGTTPNGTTATVTPPAPAPAPEPIGDYTAYILEVNSPWPPPVFGRPNLRPEERFYLENRWYSQWKFFDKKANEAKKMYMRLQQIVVIGSVIVPVLIAFGPNFASVIQPNGWMTQAGVRFVIDVLTVVISTAVAVAAAVEGLYKYGESWTTYRRAAEEMQQEKFMFDVRAGRYSGTDNAFTRFVERTEEVIAQQNGRFIQTIEKQQAQAQEQNAAILDKYRDRDDTVTTVTISSPTPTSASITPTAMAAAPDVDMSSAG